MTTPRIGLITIGQSPRDDIVPQMIEQMGMPVDVMEQGAIDGLTYDEACQLQPRNGEPWVVSRMRDGAEVRLAKHELDPRMQRCVEELEGRGASFIVPLCASDWSSLRASGGFINPGVALPAIVQAMIRPGGTLGVVSPTKEQAEIAKTRYKDAGFPVISTYAQPYASADEQREQCERAARELKDSGVDLIYMGCMGHTVEMRETIRKGSGKPTITANGLIASLMKQALS